MWPIDEVNNMDCGAAVDLSLVDQILTSEKIVRERNAALSSLKSKNIEVLDTIRRNENKIRDLKEEIAAKEEEVVQCEVNLNHAQVCLNLEEKRRADLFADIAEQQKKNNELKERKEEQLAQLCGDIEAFVNEFDFTCDRRQERQAKKYKELKQLQQQKETLLKDQKTYKTNLTKFNELRAKKLRKEKQLSSANRQLEDLKIELKKKKVSLKEAESNKQMTNDFPGTNEEYLSLAKQLKNAMDETESDLCAKLQAEQHELQQQRKQERRFSFKRLPAPIAHRNQAGEVFGPGPFQPQHQ